MSLIVNAIGTADKPIMVQATTFLVEIKENGYPNPIAEARKKTPVMKLQRLPSSMPVKIANKPLSNTGADKSSFKIDSKIARVFMFTDR